MTAGPPTTRVRSGHLAWLADRLGARDQAVMATLNQVQLATGHDLERLHFADLAEGRSRVVSRSRTLARLVRWRVLMALPRRVGGTGQGSTVTVYALDTAGIRLLHEQYRHDPAVRVRRPGVPGERFVKHVLATTGLYVDLVEADRAGRLVLREFRAEPRWPDGLGSWLRPDAYAVVSRAGVDQLWWVEVDLATESLPTIRRKLRAYVDFWQRGGLGPRGVMPRVLVTVPSERRAADICDERRTLGPLAGELVRVVLHRDAIQAFWRICRRSDVARIGISNDSRWNRV